MPIKRWPCNLLCVFSLSIMLACLSLAQIVLADAPAYDGKPGKTAGQQCVNPKDNAVMVWVPAGDFLMGSADTDAKAGDEEKPQHTVSLDGYWIYQNDVTVAEYKAYCAATGVAMPTAAPAWGWQDTHPMVNINWQEACDYAKWAGGRLPSEAQWEKAARGTDGRLYPWGSDWAADKCKNATTGLFQTSPVGSFPLGASPYGCLDMAGNVWQWCADWYGDQYYQVKPVKNPQGPDTGQGRVVRGGSWHGGGPTLFRSAVRRHYDPVKSSVYDGFRCVVSPAVGE